jgi:glycosyltransferase involved in cell wall biosynthesis
MGRSTIVVRAAAGTLQNADIFVLPTPADEWRVVVKEAPAAGLPVLGSRHSQAVEEFLDFGTRRSFDPRPAVPSTMP